MLHSYKLELDGPKYDEYKVHLGKEVHLQGSVITTSPTPIPYQARPLTP